MSETKEVLNNYIGEIVNLRRVEDSISYSQDVERKIDVLNESVMQETEKQKIKLRYSLTKKVSGFIWVQLIFFNFVVLIIVLSVTVDTNIFKKVTNDLASLLFEFLKYYMGATVAELLGMLLFILHYVFSDKIFKKNKPDA